MIFLYKTQVFKKSMGHDNFKSSGTAHLYLINAFFLNDKKFIKG